MHKAYEYWSTHEDELDRLKCIGRQQEVKEIIEDKENNHEIIRINRGI